MIGCTKLLCGKITVSDVIKEGKSREVPHQLLQFSTGYKPVVVWNITNRCNLTCKHCYAGASPGNFSNELSTSEAKSVIEDLGEIRIPVLLFSGGEPLLREDIFELGRYACECGLRPVLSTNGTLISANIAKKIKKAGFQYVGISIDGLEKTHNKLRQNQGAFKQALKGLESAKQHGLLTGVRFTITGENVEEFDSTLDLVEKKEIPRFCMYHLVYSGRGKEMLSIDTSSEEKRKIIDSIIARIENRNENDFLPEILTVDNPADGIYIYQFSRKHHREKQDEILALLKRAGGCSAGEKVANIDSQGNVHPCQFWEHLSLGNVKKQKFSQIWLKSENETLLKLRAKERYVKGKCGRCDFAHFCGGCRVRAGVFHADVWEEDPACYLSEEEIRK